MSSHAPYQCEFHSVLAVLGPRGPLVAEPEITRASGSRRLRHIDRQAATEIILNESGLVAIPLSAPCVHSDKSEVTRLPFGSTCPGDEILRPQCACRVHRAIDFIPGLDVESFRARVTRQRVGQVEAHKAAKYPAGNFADVLCFRSYQPPILHLF